MSKLSNVFQCVTEIDHDTWIGGNDLAFEATWIWTASERPIETFYWSEAYGGQPNNGLANENQHCISLAAGNHNGFWNDWICEDGFYFICEFYF